jgi:hypothetical protein
MDRPIFNTPAPSISFFHPQPAAAVEITLEDANELNDYVYHVWL